MLYKGHCLLRTQRLKNKGFTLTELLFITTVVSILATALFPTLSRMRASADQASASCQSNLQHIAQGMLMYTQDYDGRFPLSIVGAYGHNIDNVKKNCDGLPCEKFRVDTGNGGGYIRSWMDLIYPYTKSIGIFECPSQDVSDDSYNYRGAPGYGYNQYINRIRASWNNPEADVPVTLSQVQSPALTVLILDCPSVYGTFAKPGDPLFTLTKEQFAPHMNGYNVAFVDGHVKWYGKNSPISQNNAKQLNKYWKP